MSGHDKVVWSQGLFLQPHHFQQQILSIEHLVDARISAAHPHAWGFSELVLDEEKLEKGLVALRRARGVLPDGTPFSVPDHDMQPVPIEVSADAKGELICLAAPVQRSKATVFDIGLDSTAGETSRYCLGEVELRDQTNAIDEPQTVQVGRLRLRLMRERDLDGAWTRLGVARVIELGTAKGPGGATSARPVLDRGYIPPQTRIDATDHLASIATLLHGRIRQFGRQLAQRMGDVSHGVSEIADFLLLMVLNRHEPLFRQIAAGPQAHPAALHHLCLQLVGELSSFDVPARTPLEFPDYRHDNLQLTFMALIEQLRVQLSAVPVPRASLIELTDRQHGFRTASVRDQELLRTATFVLAVQAQMPAEPLRQRFLSSTKVAPIDRIQELVKLALPGIGLVSQATAPPQLPFHAGHHYFMIQREGDLWKQLEHTGNLALHVGADFPGLELQLWAIRP
jgi:type VI secretion system protein ImpJ